MSVDNEPLYVPVELQALRKRLELQKERQKRVEMILHAKPKGFRALLQKWFGK